MTETEEGGEESHDPEKWEVRGRGARVQRKDTLARQVPWGPRQRALMRQLAQLADWLNVTHRGSRKGPREGPGVSA